MLEVPENITHKNLLKIGLWIFVGTVLLVTLIQFTCKTPADSLALIEKSAMLSRHDDFCLGLPRPADFQFVQKMVGGNSYTTSIAYWYSSNLRAIEVQQFFVSEMPKSGWHSTTTFDSDLYSSFTSGENKIVVSQECAVCDPKRYTIDCSRETK